MFAKFKMIPRALIFSLMFFSVNFVLAQTEILKIGGKVVDRNQAAIENAEIRLTNGAGKIVGEAKTDAAGEFYFKNVLAGKYFVQASKNGMSKIVQTIIVSADQTASVEIILEPKQVEAIVNVAASEDLAASESETVTKTATPLRDLPQSVEVVGQKLFQQQAVRSLQDALYNVTAVSVAQGEGRRDQFFIRGFNAFGDQFVDGVRDDAPYYRDLSNVERIEVVKGPAAVLFGRGSSGGLINRVTKRPSFADRIGGAEFSFGSYGLRRGTIDYGQPLLQDKLAFRVIGAMESSNSFRRYFFQDRYNIAPSLMWKPTKQTDVLVQLEYLNDRRLPDRGLPAYNGRPLDVPIETYYGFPQRDGITNRVASQAIRIEHRLNDFWEIRNVFRHTGYGNNFYNSGPNGICILTAKSCTPLPVNRVAAPNSDLRATRFQYESSSKQNNFFNQTEIVGIANAFGWQHTLLAGVELGGQERRLATFRFNNINPVALRNPDLTRLTPIGSQTITRNDFDARTIGFYVQDQINFTRQWKALVGVRYDNFRQRLDDLQNARPSADLERTDRQWSPRVGLVYQPQEWLSLYASYTRSFQPSGENLSLAANNAELEPEMTRNYEAGVKARLPKTRLNTTLAIFRLDRNNIKTADPLDSTKLILVGQQRTDGIEATVSGSPVRNLEIYAGYALLSARILRSNNVSSGVSLQGRRAQLTPQSSGNLWLTYALPRAFRVGFGAFTRTDVFTSPNNLVTLPGFARFDGSISWRAEKHYEISFNLRNIANRRYYETSNGDNGIMPGMPINGSLTLRYRW